MQQDTFGWELLPCTKNPSQMEALLSINWLLGSATLLSPKKSAPWLCVSDAASKVFGD